MTATAALYLGGQFFGFVQNEIDPLPLASVELLACLQQRII